MRRKPFRWEYRIFCWSLWQSRVCIRVSGKPVNESIRKWKRIKIWRC
jgi:hypothetical protein